MIEFSLPTDPFWRGVIAGAIAMLVTFLLPDMLKLMRKDLRRMRR